MNSHNTEKKQIAKDALHTIQCVYDSALKEKDRQEHSSYRSAEIYYPLEKTLNEPIFASVNVINTENKPETIYFTRGLTVVAGVKLANYRAPMGRLLSLDIGDFELIQLPRKEEDYELIQKNEFSPTKQDNIWDSGAVFVFKDGIFKETSLQKFIKQKDQEIAQQPAKLKKDIITGMSLRDKPILDKIQDGIFRLSPRSQIVLMGPPGTGKTTTLIKKLGLNLDEQYSEIEGDKSWYMFTPTELLKNYLKEAFNREGIAAPDKNVYIWKNFIRYIARDVLNILKTPTGKGGNLVLIDNEQLLNNESKFQQNTYNLFFQWMNQKIISDNQQEIKSICDKIIKIIQPLSLGYLVEYIRKRIGLISDFDKIKVVSLLQNVSDLAQYLKDERANLKKENHTGLEKQIHDRNLGLIDQTIDCITALHKNINTDNYLRKICDKYLEFRNTHSELYVDDVENKKISYSELDIIVLSYLKAYNEFIKRNLLNEKLQVHEKVRNIQRTQIFVDEITDFSAVQLAIMAQLFSNNYRTFVGAGDFNQRITNNGISSEEELRWAIPGVSIQNIRIPYRQSRQLYEFSQKLIDSYDSNFEQPQYLDIEGLYPTVGYKIDTLDKKAQWLTERICEIERQIEEKLPSIAILVNEENEIEPLAEILNQYLQEYNIQVDPCLRGQVLGYENNIRIFSIDYIKGLEFEAAFFIDIDIFAKKRPTTFNRFLYVGTSRAATYLGLTVSNSTLPKKLSKVEDLLLEKWEV